MDILRDGFIVRFTHPSMTIKFQVFIVRFYSYLRCNPMSCRGQITYFQVILIRLYACELGPKFYTVCPQSLVNFYIKSIIMNLDKTSWTHSTLFLPARRSLYIRSSPVPRKSEKALGTPVSDSSTQYRQTSPTENTSVPGFSNESRGFSFYDREIQKVTLAKLVALYLDR